MKGHRPARLASRADIDKPLTLVETRALFEPFARQKIIAIAVSGGPDSTALLWLASRWRAARKSGPDFLALTVDHGLRKESAREARAVKRLAQSLGVKHRTLRWTGTKPTSGIQEAARIARYRLLADAARRAGAETVVTAHTLDDQAETVLFRLARGSGLTGLRGMAAGSLLPAAGAERITLSRPLLCVAKSRLVATLAAAKVPFSEDPSNLDPRFARLRLRQLMPALAAEGLSAERLARLAERVTRSETVIHDVLNDALVRLAPGPWPEHGPVTIGASEFFRLNDEIALRMLCRLIEWTGDEGPVELSKLETLFAAMQAPLIDGVRDRGRERPFRRTLAGALISLTRAELTVERAPPRRGRTGNSGKHPGGRISALTKGKSHAAGRKRNR
jgi:tRNA(Ile)-lysidine synthase